VSIRTILIVDAIILARPIRCPEFQTCHGIDVVDIILKPDGVPGEAPA